MEGSQFTGAGKDISIPAWSVQVEKSEPDKKAVSKSGAKKQPKATKDKKEYQLFLDICKSTTVFEFEYMKGVRKINLNVPVNVWSLRLPTEISSSLDFTNHVYLYRKPISVQVHIVSIISYSARP